jgi:hypothetical protein
MVHIIVLAAIFFAFLSTIYLLVRGRPAREHAAPDLLRAGADQDGQPDAYRAARNAHGKSSWMLGGGK